jgi:hypothetical protein
MYTDFIAAAARFLVQTYGMDAVASWEYRVGTEPDLP